MLGTRPEVLRAILGCVQRKRKAAKGAPAIEGTEQGFWMTSGDITNNLALMDGSSKWLALTLVLGCVTDSPAQSSEKVWIYKNKYLGDHEGYSWVFHDHTIYRRQDHLGDVIVAGVAAEDKGLFRLRNPGTTGAEWDLEPLRVNDGGATYWRAIEGHVDGDKIADLVVIRSKNKAAGLVWFKGPDLIYQGEIKTEGTPEPQHFTMGDMDGDGDEDLVVASGSWVRMKIHWWRNEGL